MFSYFRKKIKYFLINKALPFPIYVVLTLYCMTLRFRIENAEPVLADFRAGGRLVLASWHQRFLGGFYLPKIFGLKIPIMISQSRDGDFVANVVRHIGWSPVRGSSSRRGREALKEMILAARLNRFVVHIVDGPTGPANVIKPGLLSLAKEAGSSIVPVYVSYEKPMMFNSWDRFMVPKPFSRVLLRFDDPRDVSHVDVDGDDADDYLHQLENTMVEGYRLADMYWMQTAPPFGFKFLAIMGNSLRGRSRPK